MERPRTAGLMHAVTLSQSLLRPKRAAEMHEVLQMEHEARKACARKHRELLKVASASTKRMLHLRRREHAEALRAEYDAETGKDMKYKLRDVEPATDAEVVEWSNKLNVAMCRKWPQERGQSTYFKLFRWMDRDGSGLITLYELDKMIRELLHLRLMREAEIQRVWRWVDVDSSGTISSGEYIRLMRKGWQGFLDEQARLAEHPRAIDIVRRPNWAPTMAVRGSAWPEVTATIQEKRRHALDSASKESLDATRRYEATTRRFGQDSAYWTNQVNELEVREELRQQQRTAFYGGERRATSRGPGSSYSTPTLGHTGYKGL